MAAPADYWDTADLKALTAGGLVNEDVMQKIWDISRIPLPFTDRVGAGTADNSYTEWTEDALGAVNTANKVVSGADASGNNAAGGSRKGNHCQNSVKVVAVTERAQSTDQIGRADEYAYQLMMRQQELRRDVEAICLLNQASVADDNNATAGQSAGLPAWLTTNTQRGATGANGGFNTGTKLVAAATPGTARALSFAYIKTAVETAYLQNAESSVLMSVPQITRRLGEFILGNPTTAKVATPTANVQGSGDGVNQTAQGYINVLVTDFGTTLEIVPNRLQQESAGPRADLFILDPSKLGIAYLKNYQTKPLAKLGLSERSQISVDWCLTPYVEKAQAVIADLTPTATVVA
jgi:hypothetical protein